MNKSNIEYNLKRLDRWYIKAGTSIEALFYSKLAIMELCGWIEISMDDIVRQCAKKKLSENENIDYITNEVIGNTYSYEYKKFKKMLIFIIGLNGIEKLNKYVDNKLLIPMEAELKNLTKKRNKEAHEYIEGITISIDAPSVTIRKFKTIYYGLKNIERKLKLL